MAGAERARPWTGRLSVGIGLLALAPGLAIACGDLNALVSRGFLLEDAFYYFTIARRVIAGEGLTLDGMHPTNGFHPLHLALLLPGAAVFDQEGFLRYALVLGAFTHAATALVLWRLALHLYGPQGALAASGLWALTLSSRLQHLNGMETGLFLFLFVAASSAYLEARDRPGAKAFSFAVVGFLFGAAYLSRVDSLVLAGAVAADLLWRRRRQALVPALSILVGFGLVVLPWLLVSAWATGGLFPDSGPASRFLAQEMGAGYLRDQVGLAAAGRETWAARPWAGVLENAVAFSVFPFYWSPPFSWILGLSHFSIFSPWSFKPFVPFLFAHPRIPIFVSLLLAGAILVEARRRGVLFLGLAPVALVSAYVLYPAPPWFAVRYAAPAILAATLFVAAPGAEALGRLRGGGALLAGIASFYLVVSVLQHAAVWPKPQDPEGYHAEALWTRDHIPPGARIGCFQAGVMSYFSEHTIVNLDGVVNRSALEALRASDLGPYLSGSGVEYVSDWRALLDRLFWPRSGLRPGKDAVLTKRGFFDVWRVEASDAR